MFVDTITSLPTAVMPRTELTLTVSANRSSTSVSVEAPCASFQTELRALRSVARDEMR